MTTTLELTKSIEVIDAELASGFRLLRFGAETERQFEQDAGPIRRRNITIASLLGIVLYDLFLLNDKIMVPDVFGHAVVFRLGFFTPLTLATLLLMRVSTRHALVELYATLLGILSVGLILILYVESASPYKLSYQYGPAIIMIFVAVAQRLKFRCCLIAICSMFALQFIALTYSGEMDATNYQAAITFHAATGLLVLFTSYGVEREFRRSYLLRSRSQLLNQKLDYAAKIDPLTGLFNRRHLNEIMAAAWADAASRPCTMAVILMDIDHFKVFNDTYGHMAGDECLRRLSACIRSTFGDIAIRFGAEEFLMFLSDVSPLEPYEIADRLRAAIAAEAIPHPGIRDGAVVTASIGIGIADVSSITQSGLLAAADAALYAAKAAGRDCIRPILSQAAPALVPEAIAA